MRPRAPRATRRALRAHQQHRDTETAARRIAALTR
jgi:hypothetical protein